jgi:hypothetical protein
MSKRKVPLKFKKMVAKPRPNYRASTRPQRSCCAVFDFVWRYVHGVPVGVISIVADCLEAFVQQCTVLVQPASSVAEAMPGHD